MAFFIFNGYHSYYDLGLICSAIPFPSQANSEYTYTNIPNRVTPIRQKNTYFKQKSIDIVCINSNKSNTDYIYSVLRNQGRLILSTCKDRYFDVTVNEIFPQFASINIDKIPLSFTAMPFAYSLENNPIEVTSDTTIEVGGNYYAEPIVKLYGNGNGTISINDVTLSVYVDNYLILDIPRWLAYKEPSTATLNQTVGNLPDLILNVGSNSVSFSGAITSMDIIKNERWL